MIKINRLKISIFCLLFILLSSCKCYYYYSNNKQSAIIKENLFELESRINSYPKEEIDQLEVTIYYKDSMPYEIIKNSVKIYPEVANKKDTLKFINEYASHYYYKFYKKWPENMNIGLQFDVDSSGILIHKSIFFKDLQKNKDCEFRIAVH